MLIAQAIEIVRSRLASQADPESSLASQRYLKSQDQFYGLSKAAINAEAKNVRRACKDPDLPELEAALNALWASPYHEEKSLAVVLAGLYVKRFEAPHLVSVFEPWVETCASWDHLDELCITVVGVLAREFPETLATVSGWVTSSHMWTRRASVVAHLPAIRKGVVNYPVFMAACERLVEEKEFFIRKAIGWALRELSDRDPELAERAVVRLGARASGLTLREATRKMEAERRERILGPRRVTQVGGCALLRPPEADSAARRTR